MRSFLGRLVPALLISFVNFRWQRCWSFQPPKRFSRATVSKRSSTQVDGGESQYFTSTSAILRISYDGTRCTGWSASNDGTTGGEGLELPKFSKRSRRRNKMEGSPILPKGFVRSIEGVSRKNLAKIYGDVDPRRIVVEGCSRTDRGVHAQGMIAQIYCLKAGVLEQLDNDRKAETSNSDISVSPIHCSIPGKRLPHPESPNDHSYFEPLPMNGNLSRLAFSMNRMLPSDVQVTGIAHLPNVTVSSGLPFHPTLSSQSKRYEYKLSVGAFQDPMMARFAWYVGESLDISKIEQGCKILVGTHSFTAFQGAPRGPEDRKKQRMGQENPDSSKCTLMRLGIEELPAPSEVHFQGLSPPIQCYKMTVEGDRFLYKMVRFLVGALVAVGTGKLDCEDLQRAVEVGNWEIPGQEPRRKEFECAPAHGLVLANVDFGPLQLDWQPLRY